MTVRKLGRGVAWLDAGQPETLLSAANFIYTVEVRQGLKICCPEEIAWRQGLISRKELYKLTVDMGECEYASYLMRVMEDAG